jgi:hypothetical protein
MRIVVVAGAVLVSGALVACQPADDTRGAGTSPRPSPSSPAPASASPSPGGPGRSGDPRWTPPTGPAIPPRPATPASPPENPTDLIAPRWIGGTVALGANGNCFRLLTDDGDWYAVYSVKPVRLDRGQRVRAHVGPLHLYIYCGEGRHVNADKVVPVS